MDQKLSYSMIYFYLFESTFKEKHFSQFTEYLKTHCSLKGDKIRITVWIPGTKVTMTSPEISLVVFLGKMLIPYPKIFLVMLARNDMFSFSETLNSKMFI